MIYTILDCYTDEPAGLGVPPYLGTYPRYLAGALLEEKHQVYYITIDDLRRLRKPKTKKSHKTDISQYNLTRSSQDIEKILDKTDVLVINIGVQTPGKYLSAIPGTLHEIMPLIFDINCKKILTGPVAMGGTQLHGGKFAEKIPDVFDEVNFNYKNVNVFAKSDTYAIKGASILKQIPYTVIAEIETQKGCIRQVGCDFCTEPLKNKFSSRDQKPIIDEMQALYNSGVRHFRMGKQTCFYTYKNYNPEEIKKLLHPIWKLMPDIKVLHLDNCNPAYVIGKYGEEITKLIVQYFTPGNIAAFGVESFDPVVVKQNKLNTTPELTYKAIKIINKYGQRRGANGMPLFLPGINIIFGLRGETKSTHDENMYWLKKILDDGMMLRRINIRQLAVMEGTDIAKDTGNKYLKKNRKYYWKWRRDIREQIDFPMLDKILPIGTVLKDVKMEVYDGNNTFGRQIGTYPLIVGIKEKLELNKFYDIEVTKHMLRSITGKAISQNSTDKYPNTIEGDHYPLKESNIIKVY